MLDGLKLARCTMKDQTASNISSHYWPLVYVDGSINGKISKAGIKWLVCKLLTVAVIPFKRFTNLVEIMKKEEDLQKIK